MAEPLSIMNNQAVNVQQCILPIGVHIQSNVNPSLDPYPAALAYDEGVPGTLFIGNGVTWNNVFPASGVVGPNTSVVNDIAVFGNTTGNQINDSGVLITNVALGAASSANGDLVTFSGTGGKQLADSAIAASTVVIGPGSATSGHLASYGSGTGKLIADSGISMTSTSVLSVTLASGSNPSITGNLYMQKITFSGFNMVTFSFEMYTAITASTTDTWTTASPAVPSGYRPGTDSLFPIVILDNTASAYISGNCAFKVGSNGNLSLVIITTLASHNFTIDNLSGSYHV